jgi:hypothetical protein
VEPIKRPNVYVLPPVKLYREDLYKLVGVFKEHCKVVTIADEEFQYTSFEELKDTNRKMRFIHLVGSVPRVEVIIKMANDPSVQKSMVWQAQVSNDANHLFLLAKDLLLARKWRMKIWFVRGLFGATGIIMVAALLFKKWLTNHLPFPDTSYDLLAICGFALFATAVVIDSRKLSFVSLKSRLAQEPFFTRNGDKIIVAVIAAILGVLGTIATMWIKAKYFK